MLHTSKITIDMPTDFKNQVKASAALMGIKMKDYVLEALEEKIKKDGAEDKYLQGLALKGQKSGYLSAEESQEFLDEIDKRSDVYRNI